jgi:hypothetical protein
MTARRRTVYGYWYYVWLRPRWRLCMFTDDGCHVVAWRKKIVPMLLRHYRRKLNADQLSDLKNAYRAMPRGRLLEMNRGEFMLAHGRDFPGDEGVEFDRWVSMLKLTAALSVGKAWSAYQEHETMSGEDVVVFGRLFGATLGVR